MNTLLFFLDFVNHSVFNITYKLVVAVGESARASEGENRVTGNSRWQSGAGSPGAQSHWTGGEGADAGQEVGGVPSHSHSTRTARRTIGTYPDRTAALAKIARPDVRRIAIMGKNLD